MITIVVLATMTYEMFFIRGDNGQSDRNRSHQFYSFWPETRRIANRLLQWIFNVMKLCVYTELWVTKLTMKRASDYLLLLWPEPQSLFCFFLVLVLVNGKILFILFQFKHCIPVMPQKSRVLLSFIQTNQHIWNVRFQKLDFKLNFFNKSMCRL